MPLIAWIAFLLFWNFISFSALSSPRGPAFSQHIVPFLIGGMLGQAGAASLLSGWFSRSWLLGLVLGTVATLLGISSVLLAIVIRNDFGFGNRWVEEQLLPFVIGGCATPPVLFAAATPLLLVRWLAGIYLGPKDILNREPPPRTNTSIEDIGLLMLVLAAMLVLVVAPSRAVPNMPSEMWIGTIIYGGVLMLASAVGVLPVSLLFFYARRSSRAFGVLVLFALLAFLPTLVFLVIMMNTAGRPPGIQWLSIFGGNLGSSFFFSISLVAMRLSGFELRNPQKALTASPEAHAGSPFETPDPFADEDDPARKKLTYQPDASPADQLYREQERALSGLKITNRVCAGLIFFYCLLASLLATMLIKMVA